MAGKAAGRFREAYDHDGRQRVLLDTQDAQVWPGRWNDREYRIDLIRDGKGDWFSGFVPFDAAGFDGPWDQYRPPPSPEWRLPFQKLTVLKALGLCGSIGIAEPEELIAAYHESIKPPAGELQERHAPGAKPVASEAATDPKPKPPEGPPGLNHAEKESEALANTLKLLKGCGRQSEIVRYLWDRTRREAPIATLAKDLYNIKDASLRRRLRSVRKQLERTRDNLEDERCPLRLIIAANSVQLVAAAPDK